MPRPLENNHPPTVAGISGPLQPGMVENVCRKWVVHEDAALATRLQDGEFLRKYSRNCEERRLARQDVPLARQVQNRDREIIQSSRQQGVQKLVDDDAVFAEQLQSEEFIRKEQERIISELKDEDIARHLQEKEKKRYELRVKEKELRRQRKMLEAELKRESKNLLESNLPSDVAGMSITASSEDRRLSTDVMTEEGLDFFVPPSYNLSEREQKELQRLRDEEMALRLQDQEHKQRLNADKMKEIEMRDAELAKIMQEQELLKQQKRRRHHRNRDLRQSSDPCHSIEVHVTESRHAHSLPQSHEAALPPQGNRTTHPESFLSRDLSSAKTRDSKYENDVVARLQVTPGEAKFASRPLPDTPNPVLSRGYNMSLLRALDRNMEQEQSEILPADVQLLQSCHGRDSRRVPLVISDEDEDFLPPPLSQAPNVPSSASANIFAAIDPTWKQDPGRHDQTRTTSPPVEKPSPSAFVSAEDGYCDLEDVRAFRALPSCTGQELEMVPGQRRQPLNRDSNRASGRKANCKQQ